MTAWRIVDGTTDGRPTGVFLVAGYAQRHGRLHLAVQGLLEGVATTPSNRGAPLDRQGPGALYGLEHRHSQSLSGG